jgi:signal transduction histidine kinase
MESRRPLEYAVKTGVAVGSVAAALVANQSFSGLNHPSALFLAAVALSAWYGGLWPGLLATVLAAFALDHFYIPSASIDKPNHLVWLCAFVLVAVMINSFQSLQRRYTRMMHLQNRRQSEFIAVLGHELRNFLSPLANAVAALRMQTADQAPNGQLYANMERQVTNLTRLIDDLLDAARVTQGKVVLRRETVNLRDVVVQVTRAFQPEFEARRQRLDVCVSPEPLTFRGDRTRLEQVLVNLLTNAAKYTGPGGRIWVISERVGGELIMRVRDNGRGLPKEWLPHVFELFRQAEPGDQGGLGIGLALARCLVELHGGRIEAHSDGPGRGSQFVVRLPAAATKEAEGDADCCRMVHSSAK